MSNLLEPIAQPLELRHHDNVITVSDLWLRSAALGGAITPQKLTAFIGGELRPSRREYNLVAVALNEYLTDIGEPQLVPYVEDETTVPCPALPHRVMVEIDGLVGQKVQPFSSAAFNTAPNVVPRSSGPFK